MPAQKDDPTKKAERAARTRLVRMIGGRAKAARLRAKLTQADIAERIGIGSEVYGRIERGLMMPSVPTLWKLAMVLRISADELLGTTPEEAGRTWEPLSGEDSPEIQRLFRRARSLDPAKIRLLATLAGAMNGKARS